jgi:hypothetical protein
MSSHHLLGHYSIISLRRVPEPSAITLSSVLQRVPPHQPVPPRPFWHRLRRLSPASLLHNNNNNTTTATNDHSRANRIPEQQVPSVVTPSPPAPAVIFESTFIGSPPAPDEAEEAEAAEAEQPVTQQQQQQQQQRKRRLHGLLFRLPSRKSMSMPSLSRYEQSRSVLSDVLSSSSAAANNQQYQYHHRAPDEEEQEETKQEFDDSYDNHVHRHHDESASTTSSSSLIRVFTSSSSEPPRARSAPRPAATARNSSTNLRPYSDEQAVQSFSVRADVEPGIRALRGSYSGTIVQRTASTIMVKEEAILLDSIPVYIGKLKGWYTEIECREVFRNMCRLVRLLHHNRTVHRNLHLNQFLINTDTVRFYLFWYGGGDDDCSSSQLVGH